MPTRLAPADVVARLSRREELAFLDLREAGPFSEGHPLFAVPVPWSTFELEVGHRVTRRDTPVVLIDDGVQAARYGTVAEAGAEALARMGYRNVASVEGGTPAWQAAGYTLFEGVNVPSKVLGELAEEHFHPARVDVDTLAAWFDGDRTVALYDCRPREEYCRVTVPGADSLPIGELLERLPELPPDVPLVLTCAGRTRGLVGAISVSLLDDRPVYALENGTQGWQLSGRALARNNTPGVLPALAEHQQIASRQRGVRLLAEHGIAQIDAAGVRALQGDDSRTCLFFDVRSEATVPTDPLAAFTAVSCGQLVQATDRWIGVRGARVVLLDDTGLRAAFAAYWLRCLGFEVYVAYVDDEVRALEPQAVPRPAFDPLPCIGAADALRLLAAGQAHLVDLRPSGQYTAGHVEGARWAIRSSVELPDSPLLLVGGERARLVADDVRRGGGRHEVMLIEGDHDALVRAGAEVQSGLPMALDRAVDVVSFAHGRHEGDLDASRRYLDWEQGLLACLQPHERALFVL